MKELFKFSQNPEFENPSLIVGWNKDAGRLSPKVMEYLNEKIQSKSFCKIEPADFFSLGGVAVENNVARFPGNSFYCSERKDLVIFQGSEPRFERYGFLNAILDAAQHYGKVKELFTINGAISSLAHTSARRVLAVFNQEEIQKSLRGRGLEDMSWEGPPAVSSYLIWLAGRRGIPGVSLWPEIPFYLAAHNDFQAVKQTLSFLDKRFDLNMNLTELDEQIADQNVKIARLREENPQINQSIAMLESNLSLSEEDQIELTKEVTELLE